MTNKQIAALGLHLLSMMDKLLTLATPVPRPLLCFTGHPNHGQRVLVAGQVTVQAQAEHASIAPVGLHSSVALVELLRSDDVTVSAEPKQRAVEPVAKPACFIDDMDFEAFPQARFDPKHEFRGSKTMRRARSRAITRCRSRDGSGCPLA